MARRPKPSTLLNRSLMHAAARLHYLDGVSQLEVARRMEVSTATVSRLLSRARDEGIVTIHVADLDEADALGDRLCAALGLRHVRVLESGKAAVLAAQVGALLTEAGPGAGAVVAIGWGRAVHSIIAAGLPRLAEPVVVPTMGGMKEAAPHFQINEFVRTAAEQMRGTAHFLHAPSVASDELRAVLIKDPDTARILSYWRRVDAAILGIGDFQTATGHRVATFAPEDADRVVGDVAWQYVDIEGREVCWPGQESQFSMSRDQLRRIPLSIGVATGQEKARAILGAVRSGMINALVIDTRAARPLLDLLRDAGQGR